MRRRRCRQIAIEMHQPVCDDRQRVVGDSRARARSRRAAARSAGVGEQRTRARRASASGSPGATRRPLRPSSIRSTAPPTAVATTASPAAIASSSAFERPSVLEGSTNASAGAQIRRHVGDVAEEAHPGRCTRGAARPRTGRCPARRSSACGCAARIADPGREQVLDALLGDEPARHRRRAAARRGRGARAARHARARPRAGSAPVSTPLGRKQRRSAGTPRAASSASISRLIATKRSIPRASPAARRAPKRLAPEPHEHRRARRRAGPSRRSVCRARAARTAPRRRARTGCRRAARRAASSHEPDHGLRGEARGRRPGRPSRRTDTPSIRLAARQAAHRARPDFDRAPRCAQQRREAGELPLRATRDRVVLEDQHHDAHRLFSCAAVPRHARRPTTSAYSAVCRSAHARAPNFARTRARPAAPSSRRRIGSASRSAIARASAAGSRGATRTPLSDADRARHVAHLGRDYGKPGGHRLEHGDGQSLPVRGAHVQIARREQARHVGAQTEQAHARTEAEAARSRARALPRGGPRPTIRSSGAGVRPGSCANARRRSDSAFCGTSRPTEINSGAPSGTPSSRRASARSRALTARAAR